MAKTDEAEFTEFVLGASRSLRRLAYLLCGDWHRADDHAQAEASTSCITDSPEELLTAIA